MKLILMFNLILFCFTCKDKKDSVKSNCIYTLKTYIDSDFKIKYKKYFYNDTIVVIDERIDGEVGGVYSFNKKGNLIDYKFYNDSISYSYNEQFLKNIFYKQGNPIVRYEFHTTEDELPALYIDYFLLIKQIKNTRLEINGKEKVIEVYKSNLWSNMYSSSISFPKKYLTDKIKPMVVLKCDIIYCDGSKESIVDTINNGR
jgi:hypothetical protein